MRMTSQYATRLPLKPVLVALLAIFPTLGTSPLQAAGGEKPAQNDTAVSPENPTLPDLGKPSIAGAAVNASVGPGGAQVDGGGVLVIGGAGQGHQATVQKFGLESHRMFQGRDVAVHTAQPAGGARRR